MTNNQNEVNADNRNTTVLNDSSIDSINQNEANVNDSNTTALDDSPINSIKNDSLDMKEYYNGVVEFIKGAKTPISFAIQGEWGSGKSSLMNIIKKQLCDDNGQFYCVEINTWQFALLDASKEASSQAVIRILQSMISKIMEYKPDEKRGQRIAELLNKLSATAYSAKSIYDIIGDPVLSQFGLNKTTVGFVGKTANAIKEIVDKNNNKKIDDTPQKTDDVAYIEQLRAEIQHLVDDILDNQVEKEREELVEQTTDDIESLETDIDLKNRPYGPLISKDIPSNFEKWSIFIYCMVYYFIVLASVASYKSIKMIIYHIYMFFKSAIDHIFKIIWDILCCLIAAIRDLIFCCYREYLYLFKGVDDKNTSFDNNKKGFIFFVDDLDRLEPEMALEILALLKNVFNIKRCIFIFAIDQYVLIETIKRKSDKDDHSHGVQHYQGYLDKLIQFSIPLPVAFYDIKILLKEKLVEVSFFNNNELNSDNDINSVLNLVGKSISHNPRSAKKFINSLSLYDKIYKHIFIRLYKSDIEIYFRIRNVLLILFCIRDVYPEIFNAMVKRPYFGDWNQSFANDLGAPAYDDKLLNKFSKKMNTHLESYEWKKVLLRICMQDKQLLDDFIVILRLLEKIDEEITKNVKQKQDISYNSIIAEVKTVIENIVYLVNGYSPLTKKDTE